MRHNRYYSLLSVVVVQLAVTKSSSLAFRQQPQVITSSIKQQQGRRRRRMMTTKISSAATSSSSNESNKKNDDDGVSISSIDAPYGTWKSPITSKAITAGSVGIGSLKLDGKNHLLWLEGRPQEGGRNVVCRYNLDNNNDDVVEEVTPADHNVRTRVHEYGGGAYTLGGDDGDLFYSEFTTQRLMKLSSKGGGGGAEAAIPVTPADAPYRFADGQYHSSSSSIVCVREDHTKPEPKNVVNEIVVVVDANNNNSGDDDSNMRVVATGNDFYSNPRLGGPENNSLAYITWNHPNMPWDASELRVTSLKNDDDDNNDATTSSSHTLIAGSDGDTSVLQPLFHPQDDGASLFYISDETGYYNIYRYRNGKSVNILPMEYDFGGASPGWVFGPQSYTFLDDGRLVATYSREGSTRLVVADVLTGDGPATSVEEYYSGAKDGLPMQFGNVIARSGTTQLYFLGGSPSTPNSVYEWDLEKPKEEANVLKCSSTLKFTDDVISVPQQIEFPTTGDRTAFAYYYAPKNDRYTSGDASSSPPLLVKAHGGPTSCTGTLLNAGIQFWTSRGFAVLDVDYGGSTGYGREYRRRLRGSWGVVDVDDVCAGAAFCVTKGWADPERLCIDGGSAGGYTTLSALAFRDVFTAGTSLYGIGDLTLLAGDTHKFESRYLDGLVGEFPKERSLYEQRSPIFSVDAFSCPILLLQGDEDRVVPPNQAETMHAALLQKGLPTCLKLYQGEQHGFRKAEHIEDALDSELAFYGKIYGIDIPDPVELEIDNL